MPQLPLAADVAVNPSGQVTSLKVGTDGNLWSTTGGQTSKLNMTAANVVKASPGRVAKLIIIAPGTTSGAFTLNDCTTTGAAAASNEVFTLPYNAAANVAGAIFNLDFPFLHGITLSAVPGGGSPVAAISYS